MVETSKLKHWRECLLSEDNQTREEARQEVLDEAEKYETQSREAQRKIMASDSFEEQITLRKVQDDLKHSATQLRALLNFHP